MENIIIAIILILIVGSACLYIWKEKKRGHKCIGCPMAANGTCPRHCSNMQNEKCHTEPPLKELA